MSDGRGKREEVAFSYKTKIMGKRFGNLKNSSYLCSVK